MKISRRKLLLMNKHPSIHFATQDACSLVVGVILLHQGLWVAQKKSKLIRVRAITRNKCQHSGKVMLSLEKSYPPKVSQSRTPTVS